MIIYNRDEHNDVNKQVTEQKLCFTKSHVFYIVLATSKLKKLFNNIFCIS